LICNLETFKNNFLGHYKYNFKFVIYFLLMSTCFKDQNCCGNGNKLSNNRCDCDLGFFGLDCETSLIDYYLHIYYIYQNLYLLLFFIIFICSIVMIVKNIREKSQIYNI